MSAYRSKDETYRALWKWQTANWQQPPAAALVDRAYELGLDEFAWRLDWCRTQALVPWREGAGGCFRWARWGVTGGGGDPWTVETLLPAQVLIKMLEAQGRGSFRFYASSLLVCYALLLPVPRSEFPPCP